METPNMVLYLLKSSGVFTLLYGLYFLVFKNDRSFSANRAYLVLLVAISFLFPLITFTYYKTIELPAPLSVNEVVDENSIFQLYGQTELLAQQSTITIGQLLVSLYALVCFFLIARLLFQFFRFYSDITKNSRIDNFDGFRVYVSDYWNQSFSFFRIIILAQKDYLRNDKELLLKHEIAHAKHLHSLDLLLAELFQIFHWFNPLAYRLKHDMIEVHEYIADDFVVGNGVNKLTYQQLIIDCVSSSLAPKVSNAFSAKLLKNRFAMMTNNRLSKCNTSKYLLIIPALALLFGLMSFKEEIRYVISDESEAVENYYDKNDNSDTFELKDLLTQTAPSTNANARELNTIVLNEDKNFLSRERVEIFSKLNPKEVKLLYPKKKSVISTPAVQVDTLKFLNEKLKRLSASTTFLKSFKPGEGSRYSIIMKKGISYRFYVVDYNGDDLKNNLVYLARNINKDEEQEVNPINVVHASGYNYADFLIEETGVYHVHLPINKPNNKYVFDLHLLEGNINIPKKDKQPKSKVEVKHTDDEIFVICEVLPEFVHPDYEDARDYIAKNLKYPAEALANKIDGRVFVQFVVNKDGSLSETRVVRGVNSALDNEALRVVRSMPNWVPGTQEGQPVRVSFTFPIIFKL